MNGETVIDVHGLTKRFGDKTAVKDVDLQVQEGEIVGFLGPNGSGKTTTIRMICGLLRPSGGDGTCLGHDIVREAEAIKREVGYMTQRFSLYEDLTIRENLEFVGRLYAVPRSRPRRRRDARGSWPERPAATAGRHAFRWLEAAPGARRLHHAQAEAPSSRRADGRRRSESAPRVLGRDSPPRRRRSDRARLHPLHG